MAGETDITTRDDLGFLPQRRICINLDVGMEFVTSFTVDVRIICTDRSPSRVNNVWVIWEVENNGSSKLYARYINRAGGQLQYYAYRE